MSYPIKKRDDVKRGIGRKDWEMRNEDGENEKTEKNENERNERKGDRREEEKREIITFYD